MLVREILDDRIGFIKRVPVDKKTGDLLFSANLDERGERFWVGLDVAQGQRDVACLANREYFLAVGAGRFVIEDEISHEGSFFKPRLLSLARRAAVQRKA